MRLPRPLLATSLITTCALIVITGCGSTPDPAPGPGVCNKIVEVPLAASGSWVSHVSMSADGSRIAFIQDGRIIVRQTADESETDITGPLAVGLPFGSPRISADGTQVGVTLPGIDRADRTGYIIDIDSGTVTQLQWAEPPWGSKAIGHGFSDDLSVFIFGQPGSSSFWITPSDGAPGHSVNVPGGTYPELDADGSVIASGANVWRNGTLSAFPGPSPESAWVLDLNTSGSLALVGTNSGYYFWNLHDNTVQATLRAADEIDSSPNWAASSEDGRYVVRTVARSNGAFDTVRIDEQLGHFSTLPPVFDGVTGLSNNGRIITSTNGSYFRCAD